MKKLFHQSMKTNTLSVKKLMNNLILRTLHNCTWRLKSSFLYSGSRHQQKLKIFNLSFSSVFLNSSVVHFLRDHVWKGDISIEDVRTKEQLADIFTKPLDEKRFSKLRCELNILESSNVL